MDYALSRLKEPSTWNAIVGLCCAFGIIVSPDQKEAVLGLTAAVYALINAFWKRDSQANRGTGDGDIQKTD